MRDSSELDNLIEAGRNFRNEEDGMDGHTHPEAVGGFDQYDTLFKIGSRWYEGTVNIMVTEKGKQFKDVTKIKDVTKNILDQYGENPQAQFLSTSSINNISKTQEDVNNNLGSSPLNLNDQTNVRDLGKINAPDPDIGSIRIKAEGRNEYQQTFIEGFNRRHITPAEPANTTSYTTNKLPPTSQRRSVTRSA